MSDNLRFGNLVTAISPVGEAIDGTPSPAKRRPRSKGTAAPAVASRWRCNKCRYESSDKDDMLAHLQREVVQAAIADGFTQHDFAECGRIMNTIANEINSGELTGTPGFARTLRGAAMGLSMVSMMTPGVPIVASADRMRNVLDRGAAAIE